MNFYSDQQNNNHHHRVIFEEDVTPFILDKEENGDNTDDHGAGDADDNHQATVHCQ